MNLPNVIAHLVEAQNNFDSESYANCFSETSQVFDEGKTHRGKNEIKDWIDKANQEYKATMKPLEFSEADQSLSAEVSGSFPGSPIVLTYRFNIENDKIQSLRIG